MELYSAPGGLANFGVDGRHGRRLAFHGVFFPEGGGADTTLGWFDLRSGKLREGELRVDWEVALLDVAIAADGAVAIVAKPEDFPARVGYLAVNRKRRDELAEERVLASAGERFKRGSLAFAGAGLTWEAGGQQRSVALKGETATCTAGTTLLEASGTRVFEVIRRSKAADLLDCGPGPSAPRSLASADLYGLWKLAPVKRAGDRVAFRAGETGVGLLDPGGELRFAQLGDMEFVYDVAVGVTGPAVVAAKTKGEQQLVAALPPDAGSGFAAPEPLALLGGDLERESLAVGADERVSWRTKVGAQSVPLAGETAAGCAAGTALVDAGGVRVFELLPAGGTDARLLGCQPGSQAPVVLARGAREASWLVRQLAAENGRVAIYAAIISGERRRSDIVSFGAADGTVRVGTPAVSDGLYGEVRDATVAADGRVAIALKGISGWRVTYLAPGAGAGTLAREQRLAKPKDGVSAGSLAFDADLTALTWRNRAGAARSVALP